MSSRLPSYNGIPGEKLIKEAFIHLDCGEIHRMKESTRDPSLRRILAEAYRRKNCEDSPEASIPKSTQPPPAPKKGASQARASGGSKKKRATR
jgi:hypothetical protein